MFPELNRVISGFSGDEISELKERLEAVEEFSQRLSLQCRVLECNIDRVEKRGKFLVKWLFALSDSNDKHRLAIDELRSEFLVQQEQIDNLISEFKKLNLK